MSLEIRLYVKGIDDAVIPTWLSKLNTLGMACEIHPEFSFSTHSGFLPFKITILEGSHDALLHKTYLTGFELSVDRFSLSEEMKPSKKPSGLVKLLKRSEEHVYYASPEIDKKLTQCQNVITFTWGSADTCELRMASLASATLAQITDGVCCYPADDLWYHNDTIVQDMLEEVTEYEKSLNTHELSVHLFEKWL